jgi:hypothetical protein
MSRKQVQQKSAIQQDLENDPAAVSLYRCAKCSERIRDAEYVVSNDGIVSHGDCLFAALNLIKQNIEPHSDSGDQLHAAVQIIVTVAREHGLLLERR